MKLYSGAGSTYCFMSAADRQDGQNAHDETDQPRAITGQVDALAADRTSACPRAGNPPPSRRRSGRSDAPTMVKNEIRLAATPVTARMMPIAAPHMVRSHARHARDHRIEAVARDERAEARGRNRGDREQQEHHRPDRSADGRDHIGVIPAQVRIVAVRARHGDQRQSRGDQYGQRDAHEAAPSARRLSSREFVPKSAPAAPAVAKKPITMAITVVNARYEFSCPAGT